MKAIVLHCYGAPTEVLALDDVEPPVPADDEVLVRVQASSINPLDWHVARGEPLLARAQMGLRGPKRRVPGVDVAGTVEAVGAAVTDLAVGDEVFGESEHPRWGTFAELAPVKAEALTLRPEAVPVAQAGAVGLAGVTALQALRTHGRVEPGQAVLVVGASGGVGHLAVQIGVALGAEVTGVCGTANVDFVRSLGAAHVVDYTRASFLDPGSGGGPYDLVVQLAGTHGAGRYLPVLTRTGTVLMLTGDATSRFWGPVARVARGMARSPFVSQRIAMFTSTTTRADLDTLAGWVADGSLHVAITHTIDLAGVPAAVARVQEAHTRGKVAVAVSQS